MCATFAVYVRSITFLDIDLCLSLVCSIGRKLERTVKEYFVSGYLKQDQVPGNGVFHTLDLEKAFSFRGRSGNTHVSGLIIQTCLILFSFYIIRSLA